MLQQNDEPIAIESIALAFFMIWVTVSVKMLSMFLFVKYCIVLLICYVAGICGFAWSDRKVNKSGWKRLIKHYVFILICGIIWWCIILIYAV